MPRGEALRKLKSRRKLSKRKDTNAYDALMNLKYDPDYTDCIHFIGHDPFCVIYAHPHQTQVYRQYCNNFKITRLLIDATGSVVKKLKKIQNVFSKTLYLYEIVAFDKENQRSFPVCNMISEAHDTVSVTHFLRIWLQRNVPTPKISCSEM